MTNLNQNVGNNFNLMFPPGRRRRRREERARVTKPAQCQLDQIALVLDVLPGILQMES